MNRSVNTHRSSASDRLLSHSPARTQPRPPSCQTGPEKSARQRWRQHPVCPAPQPASVDHQSQGMWEWGVGGFVAVQVDVKARECLVGTRREGNQARGGRRCSAAQLGDLRVHIMWAERDQFESHTPANKEARICVHTYVCMSVCSQSHTHEQTHVHNQTDLGSE